jgi:hypothetical protein
MKLSLIVWIHIYVCVCVCVCVCLCVLRPLIGQDYDCKLFLCIIECKKTKFMLSFGLECLSDQYNNVFFIKKNSF